MKKIAGILICIALAFTLAGCSWKIPESVSVKTNADYNFSLGNFEKDFSEQLNVSKMIGDVQLPNNGKVYDYWPNKQGDTQAFLMYMPLQEIPIDIGSYFDKGSLADSIKNISFEKEIEVPEVSFSFPVEFNLDDVNKEINKQFVLAGPIKSYSPDQFGAILSDIADSISYEKGYLVVKAYSLNGVDPNSISSIQDAVTNEDAVDTSYSYGSVAITSGGKSINGTFYNGVATLAIPEAGFEFKSNDINISFSDIQTLAGIPTRAFIAKFDTSREYQIKKVSGIGNNITIPSVSFDQKIDSLEALKDSGVEECTIDEGSIDLDFDIPSEWKNVVINYGITMTGGIEATSGSCTASSSSSNNVGSIDLDGKSIKAEEINVSAAVALTVAGATIDFTKPPAISFDSNITRIKTVTVKLSDTSLSVADSQVLPDEVLDFISEIELRQCGIEGTYTNTLPEGNGITLTVSSDFFGLISEEQNIEGGKEDEVFSILSSNTDTRTIKLAKTPSASDEFNAFDFDVSVALPGGASDKVTVSNVVPGETYKLAINITPVIDWASVTINTEKLELPSDKISTGFDPSTIFSSMDEALGEGFSDNIEIPDCNLYLYITKPEIDKLEKLEFTGSVITMYYGDADKNPIEGTESIDILKATDSITFAKAAPTFDIINGEDGSEIVTSKLKTGPGDYTLKVPLSDILTSLPDSVSGEKQLCVDYNLQIDGAEKGKFKIENDDNSLNLEQSGSIGIYAVIEMPLSFEITDETVIDIQKMMNNKDDESSENTEVKDIFGRTSEEGFKDVTQYLDVIQSAELIYKPVALPIVSTKAINVEIVLEDDNRPVYEERLPLDTNDEGCFEITSQDVSNIFNAYPVRLTRAMIVIPGENKISIPRQKKIDVNLQLSITTDGTIELFGGKK